MKPKPKTLRQFIEDHGEEGAADRLGVSVRAVRSWRYGARAPRTKDIPALIDRAGGELTYQSFFDGAAA